jgi:hypothetical protein
VCEELLQWQLDNRVRFSRRHVEGVDAAGIAEVDATAVVIVVIVVVRVFKKLQKVWIQGAHF